MLAIRLQRTGRSGHAQYRMVVQDSRRTPSSGNIVAALGSYNPHAKTLILDKEKAATFLNNGAQPSPRVVVLLTSEGIKMPSWVKAATKKDRTTKRPDQLRSNRPAVEVAPVEEVVADETPVVEDVATDTPAAEEAVEEVAAEVAEETTADEATVLAEEVVTPVEDAETPQAKK